MTFKVIAEAETILDWNSAVDWYEARKAGLGLRLNNAIRRLLQTLSRQPERFPLVTRLTRKAKVLGPWPCSVYFTINAEFCEVKALAFWHGRRNPAELRQRLK